MSLGYVAHYSGQRRQDWTTPRAMFDALHDEYGFTLDGASEDGNALLPEARTGADILVSWVGERVFCNPPWKRIREAASSSRTTAGSPSPAAAPEPSA